jgi:hypothetical protein
MDKSEFGNKKVQNYRLKPIVRDFNASTFLGQVDDLNTSQLARYYWPVKSSTMRHQLTSNFIKIAKTAMSILWG